MVQHRAAHRQFVCLLAAVVLGGVLTSCSNGVEAGTLDPPSATGVQRDAGDLRIRNAVLVAGDRRALTVSLTVINTGAVEDALTDLEVVADGEAVGAEMSPGTIDLAPGSATVVPSEDGPTIEVEVDAPAGGYLPVTIHFENAGRVELSLPVINEDSPYGGG